MIVVCIAVHELNDIKRATGVPHCYRKRFQELLHYDPEPVALFVKHLQMAVVYRGLYLNDTMLTEEDEKSEPPTYDDAGDIVTMAPRANLIQKFMSIFVTDAQDRGPLMVKCDVDEDTNEQIREEAVVDDLPPHNWAYYWNFHGNVDFSGHSLQHFKAACKPKLIKKSVTVLTKKKSKYFVVVGTDSSAVNVTSVYDEAPKHSQVDADGQPTGPDSVEKNVWYYDSDSDEKCASTVSSKGE